MPIRNVDLTDELDRFVSAKVESGLYQDASEVVRTALRVLEEAEEDYDTKMTALRAAIDEGDASGISENDVFEEILESLKHTASKP